MDAQNAAGVWDSDHQGVWHLNEGTGVTAADATANANDATPANNPTASTGKVGGALTFFSTSWLDIAPDPSLDLSTYTDWTMSAWVKPTDYTGIDWAAVYSYGNNDTNMSLTVKDGTDGLIEYWSNDTTQLQSTTAATFNDWNHTVVTRDATSTTFYLNGVEVGSYGATPDVSTGGQESYIGQDGGSVKEQFKGLIDEVRLSAGIGTTASRSADWIEASYLSQNGTFAFTSFGSEQVATTDKTAPVATITRGDPDPTSASSVVFSVDFSEDVSNVDVGDFTLALSGVTANIASVGDAGDPDASTYTVTADTIAGNGTLGLDFGGVNGITDLVANAVNATPTADEFYTIDHGCQRCPGGHRQHRDCQ